MEYIKNCNKWSAANEWANKNAMTFKIWTEDSLRNLKLMAQK